MVQAAQERLLTKKSQDLIATMLGDRGQRDHLIARHAAWQAFASRLRAPGPALEVPWYSVHRKIRGVGVHIAAFCSAWMSWDSTHDHGRLLVGRWQAHELLRDAADADLVIAAMHHPWAYVAEFDSGETREEIRRTCGVVLSGHLHDATGAASTRPDGTCLEFAAGAIYAGSQWPNAYYLFELDPHGGRARVHRRVWDRHAWIPDRNAYGGAAREGYADFPLRCANARRRRAGT
jgi:hypothetical protein